MAILFQFMKILKKEWEKKESQKRQLLFRRSTNSKNFFLYKSEWTLSIIYRLIMIYLEALVLELDMAILFQFMKILKKEWEKKESQKHQLLFRQSTNSKNFFLYESELIFSNIPHIIMICLEALVFELDMAILFSFSKNPQKKRMDIITTTVIALWPVDQFKKFLLVQVRIGLV